jgi:hypothetical protein
MEAIMKFAADQGIGFDVASRMVDLRNDDPEWWDCRSLWKLHDAAVDAIIER